MQHGLDGFWINKIICCHIFIVYRRECVKVILYPALSIRQQGNFYSFSEHYLVVFDSWENKEKSMCWLHLQFLCVLVQYFSELM